MHERTSGAILIPKGQLSSGLLCPFPSPPPPLQTSPEAYLQVLVEDAAHGGEGAVPVLVPDEPGLGCSELLWVDEDEPAGLSEGLQHERRQPGEMGRAGVASGYRR